ncbi:MAG: ubiquinol-cytochrome c reductase iron-sulfur subunit [Corynebacterium sp.]|nr:ubiquinol-cytochrome c reductase iron-sulfur subunit [Corynebacterium sp.]
MTNNLKTDYTAEEINAMSNEELAQLGLATDGVTLAYRKERFPFANDPEEKRASFKVGLWLLLSIVFALAFIVVYIWWPWQFSYKEGVGSTLLYTFYTPLLGVTMGLAILSLAFAMIIYIKRFIPEEIAVQDRHDGGDDLNRRTLTALVNDSLETSMIKRRPMLKGMLGVAGTLAGIAIILPLGGMIKNPWKPAGPTGIQGNGTLWTSGWTLLEEGAVEKLYLARDTGILAEKNAEGEYETAGLSRLQRVRPEDLYAGSMETVFPLRPEDVLEPGEERDVYEKHMESIHGPRNAVMLIRLRSADAAQVVQREGQEDFHFGDYYAYSKICTHIGCPTSLYEAQTNRILCPCHQSQFDALHYGKPVFGPAARALPQLPITVDEEGYLVATRNFIEPLGPAFWERRS